MMFLRHLSLGLALLALPLRAATPPVPPPPMPSSPSPVAAFRELLSMNLAERRQALTNRPPAVQRQILAKLREYETLKPEQRELRLQATELRYYLLPLMGSPTADRQARLQSLPETHRAMVEARLKGWDALGPAGQRELLDNEAALSYFTEVTSDTARQSLSPARREKLEASIKAWQSLPEQKRRDLLAQFNRFFELNDRERDQALRTLSEPERRQMERTLTSFEKLQPAQRAQCIRSFEKFASLTVEERQQFLKNAQKWQLMSPSERQEWRELVARLPLFPPRITPLPPLPPAPQISPNPANKSTVATNR